MFRGPAFYSRKPTTMPMVPKIFNYAQKKYLSKARKYCKILDRAKTESYSKSKEKYPTAIFNSSGGTTCNRSYNW